MSTSVLLIEKHPATRSMLRFALELHGCLVVETDDQVGLPAAPVTGTPVLLVVGVDAPDAHSSDLIQRLRRQPGLEHLPALLVGEEQYEPQWREATPGRSVWLNKPFRMPEFTRLLESLLSTVSPPDRRFDQRLPLGIRNA